MTPGATVTAFIHALTNGDAEGAAKLCTEDLEFENVPLDPPVQRGRDRILAGLTHLVRHCSLVQWDIPRQIEQGDVVVNERVDRFVFRDGTDLSVPVVGIFTLRDGLICHWRDYYDYSMWQKNLNGRSWPEFAATLT